MSRSLNNRPVAAASLLKMTLRENLCSYCNSALVNLMVDVVVQVENGQFYTEALWNSCHSLFFSTTVTETNYFSPK